MFKEFKYYSTALVFLLVFSSNACLVECAFASEEHSHLAQESSALGRHHESDENKGDSGKENHGPESLCCPSLVAVTSSTSHSFDDKSNKGLFFDPPVLGKVISNPTLGFGRKFEFPPGASPPQVFLFAYTSHAPPVSL